MAIKGFKYRIYPTKTQRVLIDRTFGCCRFVWNTLLQNAITDYTLWKETTPNPRPNVSGFGFVKSLTALKCNNDWLYEVPTEALQQKLLDLGKSYKNFFDRKRKLIGYPKFKSKRHQQSFRLMGRYFSIKEDRLVISRCATSIKVQWSRDLPSAPTQVTVSRDASGRYFASFLCEYTSTVKCGTGMVGIDLGISALMTLSTGEIIPNPRHFNKHLKRLRRTSRRHSRKVKGSNNRNKHRFKLAKIHATVADTRRDYLQKLTTRLINENQVICLEMLKIQNMMANRRLARHIGDVGWGMLSTMLAYKAPVRDAGVLMVDTWYPSTQTCSACGHRLMGDKKLTLKIRHWVCPVCKTKHDRDINAAVNVLHQGLRDRDIKPGTVALVSGF